MFAFERDASASERMFAFERVSAHSQSATFGRKALGLALLLVQGFALKCRSLRMTPG